MDEATARAMIKQHFDWSGRDELRASQLYAEDVVLEFPQGGERVRGIMQFADDQVVRETIYLTRAWEPPAWRAQWVEPIE